MIQLTESKPDLNLPTALLSILSLLSYAIPRNRFSILLCSYFVHTLIITPLPYVMTFLLLKAQIMENVILLVETWSNNIQ